MTGHDRGPPQATPRTFPGQLDGDAWPPYHVGPRVPVLGPRFKAALLYAMEKHANDFRKGSNIPYVAHLFAVCGLVLELGGTENEAMAAMLHDLLEDHADEVTREDLVQRFGPEVAAMVAMCTDTPPEYRGPPEPKPDWHVRKWPYVERIRHETYPLCRVVLADKLHNTRSMVMDYRVEGDAIWDRFNAGKADQLRYHRALVEAFQDAGAPAHIVMELGVLVGELETSDTKK